MYVYVMSGTWVIERTVNLIYNKVYSFLNYRIERSETETIVPHGFAMWGVKNTDFIPCRV